MSSTRAKGYDGNGLLVSHTTRAKGCDADHGFKKYLIFISCMISDKWVYSPTNWYHRDLRFRDLIEGAAMASTTNTGGFIHVLPVLDCKNYDQWVVRMEAILDFHEIIGIVKEGISQKEKDDATIMKKDFKAKCLLHQCVDLVVFEKIAKASTTKDAWEILQLLPQCDQIEETKVSRSFQQSSDLTMILHKSSLNLPTVAFC